MKPVFGPTVSSILVVLACASSAPASANLLTNGGFEAGFAGWTTADQIGSDGTFFLQSGTTSPVNAFDVPPPPEGTTAAMTDQQAGGSHVLYQDFVVPTGIVGGTVSFELLINSGTDFLSPPTLDWATPTLNQQARVDILASGTDPFSIDAQDVLLNLFQTNPGDALNSGYDSFAIDITALLLAHQGQTLRLRFAEADNVFFFGLGVDGVSIEPTTVPEPATVLLSMAAMAGLAFGRRPRAQQAVDTGRPPRR